MKFYDRAAEIAELQEIQQRTIHSHSLFTVVTGRRRIGKTSLIREAYPGDKTVYLFVSRDNEIVLVRRFAEEVRTVLQIYVPQEIASFRALFTLLMEASKTLHFTLIMDEFQDFTYVNPAIFSHIQDVWDRYRKETHLNLVVCGSAYRLMNTLFENRKEPLFGRRDALIMLKGFPIHTLKEILQDHKPTYNNEDLLALYAYTGGVPKYVELFMDYGATDKDKMMALMTKRDSLFVNEGKQILIEEFGKEYGTYSSILGCMAAGYNTQALIEGMLGEASIGGYLKRLQEDYALISKIRPLGTPEGGKRIKYEISDLFLRFWFRYMHKNRSIVEIENWDLLRKIMADDYTTFTGDVLERYFRQKMREEMKYRAIGNWWDPKSKEQPCEIDIIAIPAQDQILEMYEVKRNAQKYKETLLRDKAARFLSQHKEYSAYALSVRGLSLEDM